MQPFRKLRCIVPILCGIPLMLGPLGCRPPAIATADPHDHGDAEDAHAHGGEADAHDHADVHFPITVWEMGHEVYIEHGPLVAGEPMEFVTHVSELSNGVPHTGGAIRFKATSDSGETIEHLETTPAKPGVYLPQMTFPSAGAWNVTLSILHAGRAVEIGLGRVEVFADDEEAEVADAPPEVDGIAFLKEQQWNHPTLVRRAARREMADLQSFPGSIKAVPGSHGSVTTPIAGRLHPATPDQWPRPGWEVRAGQVLFMIQPVYSDQATKLVEANAAVERARIVLADANTTFERIKMLVEQEARSQRDLQAAQKELAMARNHFQSALSVQSAYQSANLSSELGSDRGEIPLISVAAPIDGVINEVMPHAAGEFVADGIELLHTLDVSRVFVEARVPESRGASVRSISSARVRMRPDVDGSLSVLDENTGELVAVGAEVDPLNRTFPVTIETPNPDGRLRVGQQVTVQLNTGEAAEVVAVPMSAIIEEEGLETVYVQVAGETFQKRFIKTGRQDGEWVEALSGVEPGEMIVWQGAYAIRLASVGGDAIPHAHH